MTGGKIGLVFTVLVVITAEVLLHWYIATRDSSFARWLTEGYFYKSNNGRVYPPLWIVSVIPAITLGASLGAWGAKWSLGHIVFDAIIISLVIVTMLPLYAEFFSNEPLNYWSRIGVKPGAYMFAWNYFLSLSVCGVCAHHARNRFQHLHNESSGLKTQQVFGFILQLFLILIGLLVFITFVLLGPAIL